MMGDSASVAFVEPRVKLANIPIVRDFFPGKFRKLFFFLLLWSSTELIFVTEGPRSGHLVKIIWPAAACQPSVPGHY